MNFFELLVLGYKNYWKGVRFLIRHKLYWFVIFPVVLFLGIYWLGNFFHTLEKEISAGITHSASGISTLNEMTWFTAKMIFMDSLYVIFTKFALYIVVVLLSPVLSILSEKTEEILTQNVYPFRFMQLVHDVQRGLKIALRNILWEYFFIVLVLGLASFFDGTVRAVLIFSIPMLFGFYFYGFSFLDYINERRRLNIQQSVYFVSKHRGLAMAIGSIYSIFFLSYHAVLHKFSNLGTDTASQLLWGTVLVITFLLAVIAPIIAITSATLSMHELVDLSKNQYASKKQNDSAKSAGQGS
ncbi:MAG: EI24 domain-containing protein [Bacteroidetes bacterium]|nr:EI24 domain-containing protein [Bacteroidota bacterium]